MLGIRPYPPLFGDQKPGFYIVAGSCCESQEQIMIFVVVLEWR